MQDGAESHNTEWQLYFPYNPTGAGLIKHCNGLLKNALKTERGSLQRQTTGLSDILLTMNEKPQPDHPTAFHMLQQTLASPLRGQV